MSQRLSLAVRAVRTTSSGEESGPACYTRARVLAAVRQHKRKRVLNIAFGVPLAAVLMGSVAWAASDQHLNFLVQQLAEAFTSVPAPSPAATAPKRTPRGLRPSTALPLVASAAVPASATPQLAPLSSGAAADEPGSPESRAPRRIHHVNPRATDDAATERELLLYEVAHHAHFNDKNWSRAIAGWDEYLRKAPAGRFAVEVRYNRALCLVRLGRTEEALQALGPFARGSAGGYRRREAQELIERLRDSRLQHSEVGAD